MEITKKKKKVFFANILEVIQKSPDEKEPFDPEFPQCGGALWQHIIYSKQLQWKQQFVQDALERIGKQKTPLVEDIVASPKTERYRNKMEFSFGYERMRTETDETGKKTHFDESPGLGLHRRGNWREIVRISDTLLCSKECIEIKNIIEVLALRSQLPVWNPIQKKGFWRHLVVRESARTGEILVHLQVSEKKSKGFWENILQELKKWEETLSGKKIIVSFSYTVFDGVSVAPPNLPAHFVYGNGIFYEEFFNLRLSVSYDAFFQVNTPSAEKLIQTMRDFANLQGYEHVLDLFCGAGTLGLALAKDCASVTGIEYIRSAVQNAQDNAKENALQNTEFFAGMVEDVLPNLLKKKKFDVALVDPPRAGLSKKARKIVATLPVNKLVLVSCNPATFARDILDLEPFGWKLKKARPHDLFPHTPHIETVAVVEKGNI